LVFLFVAFPPKSTFFHFVVTGFVAAGPAVLRVSLYRDVATAHVQDANYKAVCASWAIAAPKNSQKD